MPLIVEDGTNVSGANTYVTVAEVQDYATLRGISLTGYTDTQVEQAIVRACDWIEAQREQFQGYKSWDEQPLQWPRYPVYIDGYLNNGESIPTVLKQAQCQLACDALSVDLMPRGTGREVIQKTVDVLTTIYAQQGTSVANPVLQKALALLRPLFNNTSGRVRVTRV